MRRTSPNPSVTLHELKIYVATATIPTNLTGNVDVACRKLCPQMRFNQVRRRLFTSAILPTG